MGEENQEQEQQKTTESRTFYIRQGEARDGYAEVVITPDASLATASFYPPATGGDFLTFTNVSEKLSGNNISSGILLDVIQSSILKANSAREPVKDVVIAQARLPVTEIPEHFVIRKDLLERKPEIDPNAARIDWHSISAFSIVQLKEPIARRIPKVEGVKGMNIYGEETPFAIRKMSEFSAGENVINHEKGLFAGKSGRLSINSKGEISIEEVLVLKKGVDFSTGNITFPGDVIIHGKVADGFKIYAGGSIVSSEVIDVTEIVCKKDLIVQSGLEGRTKGAARVGGNLTAKYIQNCRVAVHGDIIVTGSIMHSRVYSMGTIHMGDTGKLVGCECIVIGGVQALDIGSALGGPTRIRCGTDFIIQQELDIANEQLKLIAMKLMRAEESNAEDPKPELEKYISELKTKRAEINGLIPTYLPRVDTNDSAFIEVRGTIYPGSELEICHVPYSVTVAQKQVVFRLDKSRGMVVSEPLKKQAAPGADSRQKSKPNAERKPGAESKPGPKEQA